jgi:Uncharacterized protein conserved in bacteria
MTETLYEPKDMAWIEKGVLGIEWNDGHKAVYPVRYLRQQCPCAACVDEWSGARRLQPNDVPLLIMLQDVQPVGRYALQFTGAMATTQGFTPMPFFGGCVSAISVSL